MAVIKVAVTELFSGTEHQVEIQEHSSIKELKTELQKFTNVDWTEQQIFYAHSIVNDEDIVSQLIEAARSKSFDGIDTFYVILSSNKGSGLFNTTNDDSQIRLDSDLTSFAFEFDSVSVAAAASWLQGLECSSGYITAAHAKSVADVLGLYLENDQLRAVQKGLSSAASGAHTQPIADQSQTGATRDDFRWLNLRALWRVLTRMVIMGFFFGRGSIMSITVAKIAGAITSFILWYLIEIGFFTRMLARAMSSPPHSEGTLQPGLVLLGGMVRGLPGETLEQTLTRLSRDASAVPVAPGLLMDLYTLLMTLPLSLLPNWRPRATGDTRETPREAPRQQDEWQI